MTLLGDAAHAMLPAGSQAGSQAIVDARILTRALLLEPTPVAALRRYEAERLPAMNEIVLRNRQLGPEIAMQLVEDRAPEGFTRIEDVVSPQELESFPRGFNQLAGFDRQQVNERPSILQDLVPPAAV